MKAKHLTYFLIYIALFALHLTLEGTPFSWLGNGLMGGYVGFLILKT
jgi:hypothetical protein